jgi:hypothetical protein
MFTLGHVRLQKAAPVSSSMRTSRIKNDTDKGKTARMDRILV